MVLLTVVAGIVVDKPSTAEVSCGAALAICDQASAPIMMVQNHRQHLASVPTNDTTLLRKVESRNAICGAQLAMRRPTSSESGSLSIR